MNNNDSEQQPGTPAHSDLNPENSSALLRKKKAELLGEKYLEALQKHDPFMARFLKRKASRKPEADNAGDK